MKKKRFVSLKAKIIISTIILVVFSLVIISSVILVSLFNTLRDTAKAEFLQVAQKYTYSFENKINNAMNYLAIISSKLEVETELGITDREVLQKTIFNIFNEYKLLDGSSVYFESNMYDGRDAEYLGTDYGTDKSGKICWYYYVDNGETAYLSEGMENEVEFTLPHYTMAKEANKPIYTDPVAYEIEGKSIPMFTLTYPIHNKTGQFIGAVTVDLFLNDIYTQLQDEKIYESGYVIISNSNGQMIYSPRYEDIGKTRADVGLTYPLPTIEEGSSFHIGNSILNDETTFVEINTVYIPQLDTNFYISVTAPLDEIDADGLRLTILFALIDMTVVAAIALLLYYMIGKISAPLNEITDSVDNIANGNYSARIRGAYKGEFAVVKDSVNTMADSIEDYIEESKNSLRQQSLITAISQSFLSDTDMKTLIAEALRKIGQFIGVAQILYYKLEDDGVTFTCQSEWIAPENGVLTCIGSSQILTDSFLSYIKSLSEEKGYCLNSNDPSLKEVMSPYMVNFKNYISVPIFLKGNLYGALDFFTEDDNREWSDNDISMATLVSSLLSGVFERYSMESELITAKEQAEQGSRSKTQFLSRMSHEMRTPMNAIIGMTGIAKSSEDLAKKEYCLDRIDNASRHLLGVINDILDMSKIEANKFELSYSEFDFKQMLHSVLDVVNLLMHEKQQNFTLYVDPRISATLIGDEQHLAQVITNLLTNAVKFTPESGVIQLKVSIVNEENDLLTLQIEIIDSGIGISEEQQSKLFRSFEQADGSIARKYGGTGLGLAISKHIVELMDGEIWVESEIGKGAKFAFTMKVKKGINDVTDSCEETSETTDAISFEGRTALLAEDVDINREILLAVLSDTKLKIECAENGRQAVEMFAANQGRYDIIFMDVHMPEVDGLEATRRIRALGASVPIVAMTADVFNEDINKCIESGMNDHIGKPIDYNELMNTVKKYLL